MTTDSFRRDLADYILSGHAYLHVPTTENTRFLGELKALAAELPGGGRQVFVWSQPPEESFLSDLRTVFGNAEVHKSRFFHPLLNEADANYIIVARCA